MNTKISAKGEMLRGKKKEGEEELEKGEEKENRNKNKKREEQARAGNKMRPLVTHYAVFDDP